MAADPVGAAPGFDCLAPPSLRGWPALQARLVHHVKRAALRQLHASNAGEMLLLRFYLVGEESSEQALQRELRIAPPEWLVRQLDQHLADEQLHARLFAEAIVERGGSALAAASPEEARVQLLVGQVLVELARQPLGRRDAQFALQRLLG